MKLLIDLQVFNTSSSRRGIGRVAHALISGIISHESNIEPIFLRWTERDDPKALFPKFSRPYREIRMFSKNLATEMYAYQYEQILLDYRSWYDAIYNPNPLMMNVIFPLSVPADRKLFLTVYDFIPALLADRYVDRWAPSVADDYKRRLDYLGRSHVHSICISNATKNILDENAKNTKVNSTAINIGVQLETFRPARTKESDIISFLTVSGDDPRKGLIRTLKAYCVWSQKNPTLESRLKIVCKLSDTSKNRLASIASGYGLASEIDFLQYVSDRELGDLYRSASAVLFLSEAEGFGLPVAEAIASGTPVVASDLAVMREVGGDIALYVDPMDCNAAAEALQIAVKLKGDPSFQRACLEARPRFEWRRAVDAYVRYFEASLA